MNSPVLCIIFNRPDTTRKVFEVLQKVKPPKLYICAEGPRENRPDDIKLCQETRSIYDNGINWECEVHKLYRDHNSGGCGPGVSGAITWFFDHVEEGIILEDDIIPHPDFFRFCDEMLERYRENIKVKCVCGYNVFYDEVKDYPYSYYFSHYMFVWGWATWKRTWKEYDYTLKSIPRREFMKKVKRLPVQKGSKKRILHEYDIMTSEKPIDTWDYQLFFSVIHHEGLTVVPVNNLCHNIGFGVENATHTTEIDEKIMNHKGNPIYPITHPNKVVQNQRLDKIASSYYTITVPHSKLKQIYVIIRHYIHITRLGLWKLIGLN